MHQCNRLSWSAPRNQPISSSVAAIKLALGRTWAIICGPQYYRLNCMPSKSVVLQRSFQKMMLFRHRYFFTQVIMSKWGIKGSRNPAHRVLIKRNLKTETPRRRHEYKNIKSTQRMSEASIGSEEPALRTPDLGCTRLTVVLGQ